MSHDARRSLHRRRGELKAAGRIADMVPVQLGILAAAEAAGRVADVANACNYLSVLFHRLGQYADAEAAARSALSVYAGAPDSRAEALACYEFVLARILAAQDRFAEAVPLAEAAVDHYAVFHDPPDDFLVARREELAAMRVYRSWRAAGLSPAHVMNCWAGSEP